MEAAEVANTLRDFRSVKLKPEQRAFVDRVRVVFESTGGVPLSIRLELKRLCSCYSKQLRELQRARESARITNGLRKAGMTRADAAAIREQRVQREQEFRSDLGI